MHRHAYARPSHLPPSVALRRPAYRDRPSSDPTHLGGADDTVSVPINLHRALAVSDPRRAAIRHAVRAAYLRTHGPRD